MMNEKKQIFLNISTSLLQKFVETIYYFLIPILIIKKFGSEVNGLISSIEQFVSYIVLLELGLGPVVKYALFKPLAEKNSKEIGKVLGATNRFFKRIVYIFLIYLVFLCIIYPGVIDNFDYWYTFTLIIIVSLGRIFEYYIGMTYKLFLQADQKNYIVNYVVIITYIVNTIFIFVLLQFNVSIHIIKLVTALSYIIRPVFLKIYFNHKYNYKVIKDKQYKLPQQWDCLFHHIASVVQSNTDVVILTLFSSLVNVSIYSVYNIVINGIRIIITSLTSGIDAFFGRLLLKNNNLINEKFELYTFFFYTVTTIILSCTIILIIPFINVYTQNITDANYIQEAFAYIIVFAELTFVVRYPYSDLVFAKGHFKQTRNFSLIEPIVNIVLSVALVIKFGLIGVAIGTLVSMFIRTIGFIIYASKNILNVKLSVSFKKIIICYIEILVIFLIHLIIGNQMVNNFIDWIILAIIVFIIISIVIIIVNSLIFKNVSKKILINLKKRCYNE